MTDENMSGLYIPQMQPLKREAYPDMDSLIRLVECYRDEVIIFAQSMPDADIKNIIDATEIDRLQRGFNEFGQREDPQVPPILIAERLKTVAWRASVLQHIIHWANLSNIVVDGDINQTLLPSRVVALYRDLDRHSKFSTTRRLAGNKVLANKWACRR